eukprot:TRINITY_DN49544_c0_g1_i1.p1 TRINITY_DN49544_c0_g1~~TRINITY_DN49544_c0_g1_i1.p1  ORF type:complete len:732 (+),score=66.25 TRINITY_DN49544_c0_g1_i1:187-2382(+)
MFSQGSGWCLLVGVVNAQKDSLFSLAMAPMRHHIRFHTCTDKPRYMEPSDESPILTFFWHGLGGESEEGGHVHNMMRAVQQYCESECPFYLQAWMRHHRENNRHLFLIEGGGTACQATALHHCINHVEIHSLHGSTVLNVTARLYPHLPWIKSISVARHVFLAQIASQLSVPNFIFLDTDVLAYVDTHRLYKEFLLHRRYSLAYCVRHLGCEDNSCVEMANSLLSIFTVPALLDILRFMDAAALLPSGCSLPEAACPGDSNFITNSDMHLLFAYAMASIGPAEQECADAHNISTCLSVMRRAAVPATLQASFKVADMCSEWDGGVGIDSIFLGQGFVERLGGVQIVWRFGLPYVMTKRGTFLAIWFLHLNGVAKLATDFYARPFSLNKYSDQELCICQTITCLECGDIHIILRTSCIGDSRLTSLLEKQYLMPEYFRFQTVLRQQGNADTWLARNRALSKPLLDNIGEAKQISSAQRFHRDGLFVMRKQFGMDAAGAVHTMLDRLWETRSPKPEVTIEVWSGTYPGKLNSSRMTLARAPSMIRKRCMRMYMPLTPELFPVVYNESLLDTLRSLLPSGHGNCNFFPTRGLFFERGSNQDFHDDTWYNLAHGHIPGGTIAVWFAFDDVDDSNGPLCYMRGSHLREEEIHNEGGSTRRERLSLPSAFSNDALAVLTKSLVSRASSLLSDVVCVHAKVGDVVVGHEHLLHGGDKIRDISRTRRSFVVHYAAACDK